MFLCVRSCVCVCIFAGGRGTFAAQGDRRRFNCLHLSKLAKTSEEQQTRRACGQAAGSPAVEHLAPLRVACASCEVPCEGHIVVHQQTHLKMVVKVCDRVAAREEFQKGARAHAVGSLPQLLSSALA